MITSYIKNTFYNFARSLTCKPLHISWLSTGNLRLSNGMYLGEISIKYIFFLLDQMAVHVFEY